MIFALIPMLFIVIMTNHIITYLPVLSRFKFLILGINVAVQVALATILTLLEAALFGPLNGAAPSSYISGEDVARLLGILVSLNLTVWVVRSFLKKWETAVTDRFGTIRDSRAVFYPEVLFFIALIPAYLSIPLIYMMGMIIGLLIGLILALVTGGAFL